jgi:hypothetical protein
VEKRKKQDRIKLEGAGKTKTRGSRYCYWKSGVLCGREQAEGKDWNETCTAEKKKGNAPKNKENRGQVHEKVKEDDKI